MEHLIMEISDMWQDMAITAIAIIVAGYLGYKTYVFFKKPASPCDDCTGCPLKEQLKNKKTECPERNKK
ncbi:MAG: FeoB-associated Cys-rich membrane protein [Tannerella sp.]|jgi:hypothetical protein|nr:FeoB-associated Cys-rich membrane protein [Tannerella sp.]